jgi:thioredoxin reductase (NADPH)
MEPIATDAVVIGAGPVGLFQVFELGLLEIHAHVIDSLPHAGGQCLELYADKPIYDIPGLLVCTGRELIARLGQQIEPFGATFHLGQQVDALQRQADGRFLVETSKGVRLLAKAVIIAGGVGSFQPRRIKVEGLTTFENTQVFFDLDDATRFKGRHLLVAGDGEAAVQAAMRFAQPGPEQATSVTLMHRRDELKASAASVSAMRRLCEQRQMRFVAAQPIGIEQVEGRLTGLRVAAADGSTSTLPLERLLVLAGLSPKLGPVAAWGLALERKQIVVDTEKFETSTPGIFAVGDVNSYPGKKKLFLCGFHEAALAAFGAAAHVFPDRAMPLEYTTTSPRLQRVLGVAPTETPPAQ